ncbi:hypothetical protein XENTR_v10020088 [Xenopus tropicalis]|nr:hypothetical protein XENTR_v10020088 [Xenopus tropicalis]
MIIGVSTVACWSQPTSFSRHLSALGTGRSPPSWQILIPALAVYSWLGSSALFQALEITINIQSIESIIQFLYSQIGEGWYLGLLPF